MLLIGSSRFSSCSGLGFYYHIRHTTHIDRHVPRAAALPPRETLLRGLISGTSRTSAAGSCPRMYPLLLVCLPAAASSLRSKLRRLRLRALVPTMPHSDIGLLPALLGLAGSRGCLGGPQLVEPLLGARFGDSGEHVRTWVSRRAMPISVPTTTHGAPRRSYGPSSSRGAQSRSSRG
jgi:hypothetical protein